MNFIWIFIILLLSVACGFILGMTWSAIRSAHAHDMYAPPPEKKE